MGYCRLHAWEGGIVVAQSSVLGGGNQRPAVQRILAAPLLYLRLSLLSSYGHDVRRYEDRRVHSRSSTNPCHGLSTDVAPSQSTDSRIGCVEQNSNEI
jgi:hypothetical protein